MKFLQAAVALLAGQVAVAAPIVDDVMGLADYSSANPQYEVIAALDRHELEKRVTCRTIDHVIRTIGTSKNTALYITIGAAFTNAICGYVNGSNCGALAHIIQTGFIVVYTAAAHYSGAQPETLPGARKRDYNDVHASYVDWWVDVLGEGTSNLTYDAISNLPFDENDEILQRRDGDPALLSRVLFSGVTGSHSPDTKQDIIANHFADGNTLLHLPIGQSATDKLGKRVPSGSGFKISYTTRSKSRLSYSQQQEMSAFTAASWAATSKTYDMTDFIGFAEEGYQANFYYRIIPEIRGFGLNYESVDICGQMGDYL